MKKVYWSADKGIDISGYSYDLIPELFSKVFSDGYSFANPVSVTQSGNELTLYYQEPHEYSLYHVIDVKGSGTVLDGEHRIRSMTENTITFILSEPLVELPAAPENITTHVAPLGWEQVYDAFPIRIYKFKHLDNTDMFMRLVFMPLDQTARGHANVCVGRTWDPDTGYITDEESIVETRDMMVSAHIQPCIAFSYTSATANRTIKYSEITTASRKVNIGIVGDIYSFIFNGPINGDTRDNVINNGVMPIHNAFNLPLPIHILNANSTIGSTGMGSDYAYRGVNNRCINELTGTSDYYSIGWLNSRDYTYSAFLPKDIDPFNGVGASPMAMMGSSDGIYLGILRDLYRIRNINSTVGSFKDGTFSMHVQPNAIDQTPVALLYAYKSYLTIPIDD